MLSRLKGIPALAIALIALFAALGGGYAIGTGKIGTHDLANQAVTNKKIKKNTIKGNRVANDTLTGQQINESSLSGAGMGLSISQTTAATVPALSTTVVPVLTLQVPQAGSYLFISKAVLAKGGTQSQVNCRLTAEGDSDRSLEAVDAANNTTIVNTVAHTFSGAGTAVLACDNPSAVPLFVTDKRISAIPLGALSDTALP